MLCEKSVVQFACRTSVSVSCIWKTNSTGNLGQEMAIEKTILRFLGSRDFSHSLFRRDDKTSTDRRASVDHQRLAGGETSGLRGQKHRGAGDFVGLADPQQRRAGGRGLQGLRIVPQR